MANKVQAAVACHKGCVRSNNEDNFFFNGDLMALQDMNEGAVISHTFTDKNQLYGVFDGMGGGEWGERASAIAAQTIQSTYLTINNSNAAKQLRDYAYKANARIVADGQDHQVDTQGTTMAVLALTGHTYHVANVGDSRVYLLRKSKLKQLSMDHSLVGELVRKGQISTEQARKSPNNNVITRYLGMPDDEMPDELVYQVSNEVKEGDRFLLCSDGLCDLLSNTTLERILCSIEKPLQCVRQLVMDALEMGGKDNTTALIIDYGTFVATPVSDPFVSPATPITPPPSTATPHKNSNTQLL